jgi:hypothetical protein
MYTEARLWSEVITERLDCLGRYSDLVNSDFPADSPTFRNEHLARCLQSRALPRMSQDISPVELLTMILVSLYRVFVDVVQAALAKTSNYVCPGLTLRGSDTSDVATNSTHL